METVNGEIENRYAFRVVLALRGGNGPKFSVSLQYPLADLQLSSIHPGFTGDPKRVLVGSFEFLGGFAIRRSNAQNSQVVGDAPIDFQDFLGLKLSRFFVPGNHKVARNDILDVLRVL